MGDELAQIRRRFGPAELAPLIEAEHIDRTVLVQTVSSLDETREFLLTADETEFVGGVIGWVDLTDARIGDALAELRTGPGGEFLVGIRHQVHDEPDPRWLMRPDVRRGIEAVGRADLVYDLLVRTRELPAAVELVSAFPDIRFVLDHIAKPSISAGPRDAEWERAMAPLASRENVACKLSGMVTEADWKQWTRADLEPYVARVLDWYGPKRCMFGSDWPVCLLAADYSRVLYTLRQIAGDSSDVFGTTASRVYRLA